MKTQKMIWILLGLVVSISFFFYGMIASAEITSTAAQAIGFCGIVFMFLYGMLVNQSPAAQNQQYQEEKNIPMP